MAYSTSKIGGTVQAIIALAILGVASVMLGFNAVGRACQFLTPLAAAWIAYRKGGFIVTFGNRSLVRKENPRGFWAAVIVLTATGLVSLGFFINDWLAGSL